MKKGKEQGISTSSLEEVQFFVRVTALAAACGDTALKHGVRGRRLFPRSARWMHRFARGRGTGNNEDGGHGLVVTRKGGEQGASASG